MDRISDRWLLALVIGLLSLLPLLAYLQYHWLGRLSEGEAARMHDNLTVAAEQFSHEVKRVAEQLYQTFSVESTAGDQELLAERLKVALSAWSVSTPHPGLLKAIYYVDYDTTGTPQLVRFDTGTTSFKAEPWPDTLTVWQDYFRGFGHMVHPVGSSGQFRFEFRTPSVMTSPGLTVPLLPHSFPRIPGAHAPLDLREGSLLLLLDPAHLEETLFPALVETHFKLGRSSEYDVLISSVADRSQIAYASRSGLRAEDVEKPDVSLTFGLLGPPSQISIVNASVIRDQVDRALGTVSIQLDSLAVLGRDGRSLSREAARALQSIPAAPEPPRFEPETRFWPAAAPAVAGAPEHTWQLDIKHRAGSLEAAVTAMRWRNLTITSAILLLLGIALFLLYLSLRRAREVAARQMEFVAGVSHELRTPLSVIGTAAENLADGVVEGEDQRRRYGELITRESRRLTTMVQQILALAGAESDTRSSPRPVVVREQVERVLSEFEPEIANEGFTVRVDIPADLPKAEADPSALATVLRNLISNALKYSDGRRTISIYAYEERVEDRDMIVIAVQDEGMGIPPRELSRIFEPFYRGQRARDEQIRGSGIGLNLSRKLVEVQGGSLSAESTPGAGSTFRLHLAACHKSEPDTTVELQSA